MHYRSYSSSEESRQINPKDILDESDDDFDDFSSDTLPTKEKTVL